MSGLWVDVAEHAQEQAEVAQVGGVGVTSGERGEGIVPVSFSIERAEGAGSR